MSKHIEEWLGAYLDGELQGSRLQHVEIHLAQCSPCQAELAKLEKLSRLVSEVPEPQFAAPERSAAQVILRLPAAQAIQVRTRVFSMGWWIVPVGLLAAWVFIGTSFFISDLLSVVGALGWLHSVSGWLTSGPGTQAFWSSTLGQFGILSGRNLIVASVAEAITKSSLAETGLQIWIALLYLSWLAIWWTRSARQRLNLKS
ncbi:MAG: anti-sigma factor family protein [Syntrophothermus sp.]